MNSITKLELKKIISNKSVMIACFLVIIYILVALYGSIITEEYTKLKNNDSTIVDVKGLEAIKLQRQDEHKIAEYLSEDKLSSIINYYHELKSDKNNIDSKGQLTGIAYFKYWNCYSNIQSLIAEAYSDINFNNHDIIKQLRANDAKEFYSNRIKNIKAYLDNKRILIDENDKKVVIKSANKLSTPLYYDYIYGWERLCDKIIFLNILLIIIICFCVSRVFTKEYKSGMIKE